MSISTGWIYCSCYGVMLRNLNVFFFLFFKCNQLCSQRYISGQSLQLVAGFWRITSPESRDKLQMGSSAIVFFIALCGQMRKQGFMYKLPFLTNLHSIFVFLDWTNFHLCQNIWPEWWIISSRIPMLPYTYFILSQIAMSWELSSGINLKCSS